MDNKVGPFAKEDLAFSLTLTSVDENRYICRIEIGN